METDICTICGEIGDTVNVHGGEDVICCDCIDAGYVACAYCGTYYRTSDEDDMLQLDYVHDGEVVCKNCRGEA